MPFLKNENFHKILVTYSVFVYYFKKHIIKHARVCEIISNISIIAYNEKFTWVQGCATSAKKGWIWSFLSKVKSLLR